MGTTGDKIKGVFRQLFGYENDTDNEYSDDVSLGTWIEVPFTQSSTTVSFAESVVARVPYACRLKAAHVSTAALAAHDSNYVSFSLGKKTGAAAAVVMATGTTQITGGAAQVLNVPRALTRSTVVGACELAAGDALVFSSTTTGTLANVLTAAAGTEGQLGSVHILLERVYA